MSESLLLSLLGGVSGVALALWLSNNLIGMMSAEYLGEKVRIVDSTTEEVGETRPKGQVPNQC
jgi:ABC-type antimicrobial peptide transport system permease subunit